jgi:GTPase
LAENKLFATLDTTTRKVVFERMPFLLSDTVGFIRKLPHHLVESFKSTLDEVREADLLLHVVDISHPHYEDQVKVVNDTLDEIGAANKPTILVFNKMDAFSASHFDEHLSEEIKKDLLDDLYKRWQQVTNGNAVFVSAVEKDNIDVLRYKMYDMLRELYRIRYPYKSEFF